MKTLTEECTATFWNLSWAYYQGSSSAPMKIGSLIDACTELVASSKSAKVSKRSTDLVNTVIMKGPRVSRQRSFKRMPKNVVHLDMQRLKVKVSAACALPSESMKLTG